MANVTQRPKVGVDIDFRLNEDEARALDALAGYGFDQFVAVFYKQMGDSYLKPHAEGLRTLFESIRRELPPILSRLDAAKEAFSPTRVPKVEAKPHA